MPELESLEFQIKSSTSNAYRDVDKLAKSLDKLGTAFSQIKFQSVSDNFRQLQNAIANVKNADVSRVERLADAMERIAKVRAVSNTFNKAAQAETEEAKPTVQPIAEPIKEVEKEAQNAEESVQKVKDSVKDLHKETKKTQSAFGKLWESVKRIAFYRMLRTAMKEITQAFKEGFDNMYQWSKLSENPFAKHFSESMDTAASAVMNIKNALAVSFYGVVESLIPLLSKLADVVIVVANNISRFMAIIRGAESYTVVRKTAAEYQKMAGSTGKIVKDLLKIDEINRLSDPNGGSGGGSGANYNDMFEEVQLDGQDNLLTDLALSVRDIFFEWDNLNSEQVAQKIITGLSTLIGGAVGFMFGGVPGALIGSIVGASLGVGFSAVMFDNDGRLSNYEVVELFKSVLAGLLGAAVGFAIGSVPGALIGFTIGASLSVIFKKINAQKEKKEKSGWDHFIQDILHLPSDAEWAEYIGKFRGYWQNITGESDTATQELQTQMASAESSIASGWSDMWNDVGSDTNKSFDDMNSSLHTKWDGLKQWWSNLSLPSFKIQTPHISWTTQEASGWIAKTLSALGLPTSIPKMQVQWYAKGGIVDGATLIGAGEAGREAIIPLENNTEWMDKVAQRMAIALSGETNSEQVVKVYLDGKQISNAVTKNQNRTTRAMGVY